MAFSWSSIVLLASLALSNAQHCYWQNSTLAPSDPSSIAPSDVKCFPGMDNSPCCAPGWSCLSDGVCYIEEDNEGFYYRGTCTDPTWTSNDCPGWCFAENSNTSIPLQKCSTTGADTYCCPSDPDCDCTQNLNVISLGAAQPSVVTKVNATSWSGFTPGAAAYSTVGFVSNGTYTVESSTAATANATSTTGTAGVATIVSSAASASASGAASSAAAPGSTSYASASSTSSASASAASASHTGGASVILPHLSCLAVLGLLVGSMST